MYILNQKITVLISILFSHCMCIAYDYDLVVIGGGAAGITAAYTAAQLHKKVLLVEKIKIGGGKIWAGDLPFKILFHKSAILNFARNLLIPNKPTELDSIIDTAEYLQDIRYTRNELYNKLLDDIRYKNIDSIIGEPFFIDKNTIDINQKKITSQFFIIATGARTLIPKIENIENINYLTREKFFSQNKIPDSMIIVGGGPLAVEMASCLSILGIKVHIVMKYGMLLPTYDFELVEALTKHLISKNITIHLATETKRVTENASKKIILTCANRAGIVYDIQADSIFLAAGNTPNLDTLNLDAINILHSPAGIAVNKEMQTSIDNVYACGDIVGIIILTRIAYYHAKLAVHNMFNVQNKKLLANYTHVTKVVFTTPQFASAGLTEQEARKLYGNNIDIFKIQYDEIEKAYVDQNTFGIAKFICDKQGYLIGTHILGSEAGTLVDTVSIGSQFNKAFYEEAFKIRTSPSYYDIIEKASQKTIDNSSAGPKPWYQYINTVIQRILLGFKT